MPGAPIQIVLATQNRHKVVELLALLRENAPELTGLLTLTSLAELDVTDDVIEDGASFTDNALIKARAAHARTGLWALADDSGLEVAALGGAPGIHSARYGGEPRSDARNLAALVAALAAVPAERRQARFVCALALYGTGSAASRSAGTELASSAQRDLASAARPISRLRRGECCGRLLFSPVGTQGFGYDPLFVPDLSELAAAGLSDPALTGKTYAELAAADKNRLSHRTRAVRAMVPILRALCAGDPLPP